MLVNLDPEEQKRIEQKIRMKIKNHRNIKTHSYCQFRIVRNNYNFIN